jgi:ssDNA-binding replication factor A large subunit
MVNGNNWTRKAVILEDLQTNMKIRLTLWNGKCSLIDNSQLGAKVRVINVIIEEYHSKKNLRTTPLTTVEVS